jgi:hypothetical protein
MAAPYLAVADEVLQTPAEPAVPAMVIATKGYVDGGLATKQNKLPDTNAGAGKVLRVKSDGSGVEWSEETAVDISGKADKATTVAGYGITDAASAAQGAKADTALQPESGLDASKLAGTAPIEVMPDISAEKIASGILDASRLPVVPIGTKTSGELPADRLPRATATTKGGVMVGSGLAISEDGVLSNTGIEGQIHWISPSDISGTIGTTANVLLAGLTPVEDTTASQPVENDIIYGDNSAQMIVSKIGTDSGGHPAVFGTVVVTPPTSGNWSGLSGSISNNSYIPFKDSGGAQKGLLGLAGDDVFRIGSQSVSVNVASDDRMTNNGSALAYQSDVLSAQGSLQENMDGESNARAASDGALRQGLDDEIRNREAGDSVLQGNVNAEAARAGAAETALQANIDSIINDGAKNSYSSTLSAHEILSQITQAYQPIQDVATESDLPDESGLAGPSICFVDSTGSTWLNSKTGSGWKNSGQNFATLSDVADYLADNAYIRGSQVANNLTTGSAVVPLSAAMGKKLNEEKLSATEVVNNLTSDSVDNPLSAAQGKALNQGKLGSVDVVDNLTSGSADKPLSANQGKVLNDKVSAVAGYFDGGKAKNAKQADAANTAAKLETPRTVGVSLSGFASGSGTASFDGSGNIAISIATQGALSSGFAAESSIGIKSFGSSAGWVYLGTFTLGFSGTFKMSYTSGMMGADWTIIHGTRSGEYTSTKTTIINNQQRNFSGATYSSGIRVYSQNVYPISTYKVFLYVPSFSGGTFKVSIGAESGATLPTWSASGFKAIGITDTSDAMFPSAADYPKYWSPGGNDTSIVSYPIGYTTSTANWWIANPKT